MTKEQLSQEIQVHDHHHAMSDDNRVWRQGVNHYQLIQDELKKQLIENKFNENDVRTETI